MVKSNFDCHQACQDPPAGCRPPTPAVPQLPLESSPLSPSSSPCSESSLKGAACPLSTLSPSSPPLTGSQQRPLSRSPSPPLSPPPPLSTLSALPISLSLLVTSWVICNPGVVMQLNLWARAPRIDVPILQAALGSKASARPELRSSYPHRHHRIHDAKRSVPDPWKPRKSPVLLRAILEGA
jgi:hypothetical protein